MNVKDLFSLKDKIILVTGGSGNYGKCIVEGLAEADGTVITASRNMNVASEMVREYRSRGLDVHAMSLDQANNDSVLNLKTQILKIYFLAIPVEYHREKIFEDSFH